MYSEEYIQNASQEYKNSMKRMNEVQFANQKAFKTGWEECKKHYKINY